MFNTLFKFKGHSCLKTLSDLWVPKPDPCFDHQRENRVHKSNVDLRDPRRRINFNRSFWYFKKKLRGQSPFVFSMAKAILLTRNGGFLRRRTTHSGQRSGGDQRSSCLLGFWSHCNGEIFKKIEKSSELYVFWESLRALDVGLIEGDE